MSIKNRSEFRKKWHLAIFIVPVLFGILILKYVIHSLGYEVLSLNALFTSLIAANIFLIGFLINGVISDYKESEKIPTEMVCSLEVIYGEVYILNKNKDLKITKEFLILHEDFVKSLNLWFYKKEKTKVMLDKLHDMDNYFAQFESLMQANFLSRMKNEQSNLRKMILRVDNIRDLNFIGSAYLALEVLGVFLIIGLLLLKMNPFYESMFFTLIVSFLIIYMTLLIKDLDNPFDYNEFGEENGTVVSLKPIQDFTSRIFSKNKK